MSANFEIPTPEECFANAATALNTIERYGGTDNRLAYSAVATAWTKLGLAILELEEG